MAIKKWKINKVDTDLAAELAVECELNPFLALLLVSRGITTPEDVTAFLFSDDFDDPYSFADMDVAVDRISRALDEGENILVYGDYDADGITATALLYSYLKEQGGQVSYRLPTRAGDGYGLHCGIIDECVQNGIQLIITVDNGITANEEIAYAVEKGIDVVVTDHHKPQGELPGAVAVVDPHRSDCPSGCTGYAGVGVAFMLVCALEGDVDSVMNAYGDLVAIGTLADVMPLTGNVRTLVRMGLDVLNRKERKGILELCKVAGLADKPITASRTVFGLAPRLNASGRMADPVLALELLLSDGEESQKLAHSLQDLNTTRQNVEQNILKEIFEQIEQNPCLVANRVIVVSGKDWPMGVVGILASRLTDRYGKPAIVISQTDGVAKGSGRSISGFSLFDALQACEKELLTFGGHELAAGLTVDPDKINDFRTAINTYAKEKYEEMPVPELRIEFKINPATIDAQKAVVLSALEPTGMGNPAPVFGLFNVRLDNITPLSGNQHMRLSFTKDNHRFEVMHFFTNCKHYPLLCGETYHLAVSVEATNFNNIIKPTVILKDVRYADTDEEALITSHRLFDRIMCKEDWKEILPTREQMKLVYGFLHSKEEVQMTLEQLHHCFKHSDFSLIVLRTMLEIWKQAGLIKLEEQGEVLHIECIKTQQKADLTRTPLWEYLDRKE